MSAEDFLTKAEHALASAKILLDTGDIEATANRAYYAMFNAARAALLSVGETGAGSHGTIIRQFGLKFVRSGMLSPALGRAINEAQRLRVIGDYSPGSPDPDAVRKMVAEAEAFVTAVRAIIPPDQLPP